MNLDRTSAASAAPDLLVAASPSMAESSERRESKAAVATQPRRRGWLASEPILSLILVLLCAALLRLPFPDLTPFGHDEALEAERARPIWYGARPVDSEITSWFIPDPAGLLYYFSLAEAFPQPAVARVIQMALTNTVSVLLCYVMARRFFGPGVGLAAGLLYAVNPWAVTFARQPWVITQPLLTTIMLYAAMMVVVRRDRRWVIPFFLAGAAQTQTHLLAVLFGPPVLLTLLLFLRRWLVPQLAVATALALVMVAPYALHLLSLWEMIAGALGRGNRGITLLPDPTALTLTSWLVSGFNLDKKLGFDDGLMLALRSPLLIVGAVAIALLLLGMVRSARSCWLREAQWQADALVLIWLLAPLTLMTWQSSQVYIHYVLCLVPVPFLVIARGAAWVAQMPVLRVGRAVGIGAVVGIAIVQVVTVMAFYAAIDRMASAPASSTTATDWQLALNRQDLTARQLGIGELHGLPLRYWQRVADEARNVARRAGITRVVVISGVLDDANRHLDRRRKAMSYLLGPDLEPAFPLEGLAIVPTRTDALFLTLPDEELPRVVQRGATRLADVPQPGTSGSSRIFQVRARQPDEVITLRRRTNAAIGEGARLVVLDVPTDVVPGQTAPMAAYLLVEDATRLPAEDLTPTVELLDRTGQPQAAVRRSGLPRADWRTGDLLIQQVNLTVPVSFEPGEYDVRFSLTRADEDGDPSAVVRDLPSVRGAVLRVRANR